MLVLTRYARACTVGALDTAGGRSVTVVRMARARRVPLIAAAAVSTAVSVALVADLLGGGSWLESPLIWSILLVVAVALLMAARVRHHLGRSLLLGLPVLAGGSAAIAAGAWDYLPWLTSPWLWLGIATSVASGAWLIQTHRAQPTEVAEGIVLGAIVFGLAWVALLATIVFVATVWRPL